MNRELFGTDGVRSIAGEYPLDDAGAFRIGMAVGTHFAQAGDRVVIAQDPRESSQHLVDRLTAGLNAVGVDVTLAGILPTPALAYSAREGDYTAGVMVTASHNPLQYNGVKVFDGRGDKLSDSTEATLNKLIEDGVPERGPAGSTAPDDSLNKRYEDFLVASAGDFQLAGMSLAVDSANGAASGLAERVFTRLGARVTPLFDKPDGRNINLGCGATDTAALSRAVVDDGLDLGVALDGDADRVVLIDSQGREVNGDGILYIVAVAGKLKGVVATVMSNFGLESGFRDKGIALERVQVGDRYVLEGLQKTGFTLGGEQSGHIIFPELLKTGDALLAAVQAVKAVRTSGRSLADWRNELKLLPQTLVNIPLTDKALLDSVGVQNFIREQTQRLDGQGRLLIRPSGTEPLVRVMVEAPEAERLADDIAAKLKELLA